MTTPSPMTTPSLTSTSLRVEADRLRNELDSQVLGYLKAHPGCRAAALALAAGSEVKALLAFVTKHHVPGYPRNPDQSRAIDRSLQRLRRKKAVVFASASGWHPA